MVEPVSGIWVPVPQASLWGRRFAQILQWFQFAVEQIIVEPEPKTLEQGWGGLFTITGRMNWSLSLAGRKLEL